MRGQIEELHISVGLPASGKTTLFSKFKQSGDRHIQTDLYNESMEYIIGHRVYGSKKIYLDGLFLSYNDIDKILSILKDRKIEVLKVIIHYFNEDREACLHNDLGRRDVNSTTTISNATFESLSDIKDKIKTYYSKTTIDFSYQKYDVVKKPEHKIFSDEHDLGVNSNGYMVSDSWCTGGTWANCWGDSGTVDSDTTPEFDKLDDLLSKLCPNLSFLMYKKLKNMVEVEDFTDGDYYGGITNHKRYQIHIPTLYTFLIDNELIESYED